MTEQIKLRVVVDGKVVAYEYVKDGYWCHEIVGHDINLNGVNEGGYVYSGTYPPPGDRERFTGRLDSKGTEIYENDRVRTKKGIGVIEWFDYMWFVMFDTGGIQSGWHLCDIDNITVIGRHEEAVCNN